jgi:putative Mg2+ transporter-C (MgtC) family protein
MTEGLWWMLADLGGALIAGSLIGLEREFRARPAGFRTHALVAFGSALAMLVPPFVPMWIGENVDGLYSVDPIKITEGVLAGVGFIGAGVIFKEQMSVRGLTTAASIWVTAALGMLFGIGHHVPAIGGTIMVLVVLSVFDWIESLMPAPLTAQHVVRFRRAEAPDLAAYKAVLGRLELEGKDISFSSDRDADFIEYRMRLVARDDDQFEKLAQTLEAEVKSVSFEITPTT